MRVSGHCIPRETFVPLLVVVRLGFHRPVCGLQQCENDSERTAPKGIPQDRASTMELQSKVYLCLHACAFVITPVEPGMTSSNQSPLRPHVLRPSNQTDAHHPFLAMTKNGQISPPPSCLTTCLKNHGNRLKNDLVVSRNIIDNGGGK